MAASPSITNYTVGKGICMFATQDLGNAPEFVFTPELESLDHFSSRAGVRTKDATYVIEKKGSIRIVLDEWSEFNLRLAILAASTGAIEVFASNSREGALVFTGTNEIGPKYTWTFPSVTFIPSGDIGLISDEFNQIELAGTVNAVAGVFGTVVAQV